MVTSQVQNLLYEVWLLTPSPPLRKRRLGSLQMAIRPLENPLLLQSQNVFFWKALSNALPLGTSLATRGISTSSVCKQCGSLESTAHVFVYCPFSTQVWALAPIFQGPSSLKSSSMKTLLQNAKGWTPLPPKGLNFTPLYPWNLLLFEDLSSSPADCITRAISEALSWQATQGFCLLPRSQASQRAPSFVSSRSLACFSDAAWREDSLLCGLGCFIRNPAGEVITSKSDKLSFVPSAFCGEALALRSALLAAQEA